MLESIPIIDLHTHSTASDGTDTPAELIELALKNHIDALALTDHDTQDGLDEAEQAAKNKNLHFIRGCEISTESELGGFHVLGLWLPKNNADLKNYFNQLIKNRNDRNEKMIEKLRALGLKITLDDAKLYTIGTVGKPHIAGALVKKGYAANIAEAFDKYIGDNCPAYVKKVKPHVTDAVQFFSSVGATVVLAHPLLKPKKLSELWTLILQLKNSGLDAVEAWHTAHSPEDRQILIDMAESCGMGISGGSDYHGLNKPNVQLGRVSSVDPNLNQVFENLKATRRKKGLPC